jgi:hypothetical protein
MIECPSSTLCRPEIYHVTETTVKIKNQQSTTHSYRLGGIKIKRIYHLTEMPDKVEQKIAI